MWKKVWKKEKYIAETEIGKKYTWIEFSEKGLYEIFSRSYLKGYRNSPHYGLN